MTDTDNVVEFFGNVPKKPGEAALWYASKMGWRLLPLHSMRTVDGEMQCSCGETTCEKPGKHPYIKNNEASADLEKIKGWWKKWPHANIGFWLEGSDLACLDIDIGNGKDGAQVLRDLLGGQAIPTTLMCDTPSGGRHIYYKDREGLPNKSNALGPGLDIWKSKHYLIVPPSNHKAGGNYVWSKAATPVDWPDVLMPRPRGRPTGTGGTPGAGRPITKERLDIRDKDDVAKLAHAMTFVEASDRDTWVHFGYILARLYNWNEDGFKVFNEWAATASNYSEAGTVNIYFKDSKNPAPGELPLTTAYIFKCAQANPNFTRWEKTDGRLKFFQSEGYEADDLYRLTTMVSQADLEYYEREARLIEVVRVGRMTDGERERLRAQGIDRDDSYCITRQMTPGQFVMKTSVKIAWWKKVRNKMQNSDFDRRVANDFLGMGDWPGMKKFRAFVMHPTLRSLANPTILTDSGFDEESGLYLEQPIRVTVPTKPTLKDAQKAAKTLLSPFEHFAWLEGEYGKASVLVLILTIGLRHCFRTAPMFLASSPIVGSGKTKLMAAATAIWYGAPPPTMMYVENEEEMEKRIGASIMAGDRVMLFDNVVAREEVNDRTLNMILTSGMAQFRILGESNQVRMSAPMTIMMTGNRMSLGADLSRRTVEIKIDPQGPLPTARIFPWEPIDFVINHRRTLIEAAMTILKAYFDQKAKSKAVPLPPVPSFEDWSVVRDIVVWLGMEDVSKFGKPKVDDDDLYYPTLVHRVIKLLCDLKSDVDMFKGKTHPADILPLLLARGKEWESLFHDVVETLNSNSERTAKHDDPRSVGAALARLVDQAVKIGERTVRLKSIKRRLFWLEEH